MTDNIDDESSRKMSDILVRSEYLRVDDGSSTDVLLPRHCFEQSQMLLNYIHQE